MSWLPVILAATTVFTLVIVERTGIQIGALAVQYIAVAWLSALALPVQVAVVKVVAGMITCGILALTAASSNIDESFASGVAGRSFRGIAAVIILAAAIGIGRSNWIRVPDIEQQAAMAAAILMSMGMLQLGLFRSALRVCIGLITLLSGFEIAYSVIEPALAILALLASVHIGLALVVSYLTLIARPPEMQEDRE